MSALLQYRIFLEAMEGSFPLPAGWYGPKPGVQTNRYIYCRVEEVANAWKFNAADAVRVVQNMLDCGYKARCVPPITVTY